MDINQFKKEAKLIIDNERYRVYDYVINKLVLSLTELKPFQETTGNQHKGREEIYWFVKGKGKIQIGHRKIAVKEDDVIIVPSGIFHKVFNPNRQHLIFYNVFEKHKRNSIKQRLNEKC
jgi:mannose-6-phosphate isomerase-like protein (cupin superfamily)